MIVAVVGVIVVAVILMLGGGKVQPAEKFKLPDTFITMQGPIAPCEDITPEECEHWVGLARQIDSTFETWCTYLPLSLIDYYPDTKEPFVTNSVSDLECMGRVGKAYCQIELDGKLVKNDCFEMGLAAAFRDEQGVDLTKEHTYKVCCSAKYDASEPSFDTCKSFVMAKVC